VRAKVGDRYVLEELARATGWLLGGEGSGHLLALDKHTTGDGLISALQVLQSCVRSGQTMAELLDGRALSAGAAQRAPAPGQDWKANEAELGCSSVPGEHGGNPARLSRSALARAAPAATVLTIRASGTEPLLRVMVEARDHANAAGGQCQ
jgi:phosphoglucosamine mutase